MLRATVVIGMLVFTSSVHAQVDPCNQGRTWGDPGTGTGCADGMPGKAGYLNGGPGGAAGAGYLGGGNGGVGGAGDDGA